MRDIKCAVRLEVRPVGVEPTTYGFEVRRSIQLSYGRDMLVTIPQSWIKIEFKECIKISLPFVSLDPAFAKASAGTAGWAFSPERAKRVEGSGRTANCIF